MSSATAEGKSLTIASERAGIFEIDQTQSAYVLCLLRYYSDPQAERIARLRAKDVCLDEYPNKEERDRLYPNIAILSFETRTIERLSGVVMKTAMENLLCSRERGNTMMQGALSRLEAIAMFDIDRIFTKEHGVKRTKLNLDIETRRLVDPQYDNEGNLSGWKLMSRLVANKAIIQGLKILHGIRDNEKAYLEDATPPDDWVNDFMGEEENKEEEPREDS